MVMGAFHDYMKAPKKGKGRERKRWEDRQAQCRPVTDILQPYAQSMYLLPIFQYLHKIVGLVKRGTVFSAFSCSEITITIGLF